MKLSRAKLMVVLLTVVGMIVVIGVTTLLFVPTFKDIRSLSTQIGGAYAELEAQYANRKHLLSSITKAQEARATSAALAPQFLPVGHELDFIKSIEAVAAAHGVEERITLSTLDGGAAPELKVGFDITLNGDFRSVLQALVDLEKLPTLLIVDAVVVRPTGASGAGESSFLSVTLRGSVANPPPGL